MVNLSSAGSFLGMPGSAPYAMSKWAVRGLSESLWVELAAHGIGVTAVCPGFVGTGILERTRFSGWAAQPEVREEVNRLMDTKASPTDAVVRASLRAVQRNARIAPVTMFARVAWRTTRWFPGAMARAVQFAFNRQMANR